MRLREHERKCIAKSRKAPHGAETGKTMLDQTKIVDMASKRKTGGPVVAIGPTHGVDLSDRTRLPDDNGGNHFPWRWVLVPSLAIVGLIWLVSAI